MGYYNEMSLIADDNETAAYSTIAATRRPAPPAIADWADAIVKADQEHADARTEHAGATAGYTADDQAEAYAAYAAYEERADAEQEAANAAYAADQEAAYQAATATGATPEQTIEQAYQRTQAARWFETQTLSLTAGRYDRTARDARQAATDARKSAERDEQTARQTAR